MNLFKLSWKNIVFRPLSSILSIVLIAFGVGLLCLLVLFQKQFEEQFEKNQGNIDLVIGAKGSPLQLILSSMFHVDSPTGNVLIDDVKFAFNPKNPIIETAIPLSIGDSHRGFRIIGTNDSIFNFYKTKIAQGRIWNKPMEAVLGKNVADKTGLKIGDTFFSSHGFNEGDLEHDDVDPFVVIGILESHGSIMDRLIFTHFSDIWKVHEGHDHGDHDHGDHDHGDHDHGDHDHGDHDHGDHDHGDHDHADHDHADHDHGEYDKDILKHPTKSITSILIRYKKDMRKSIPAINMPRSINENTGVMAAAPPYQINKLLDQLGSGLKAIEYLAYLIACISGISIFISLLNNLKDRKRELQIMRIGGGRKKDLLLLVLYEAILITVVGIILGILLAHVGTYVLSSILEERFNYQLSSSTFYINELWIACIVFILSLIAAIYPAYKAWNTKIIR